MTIRPYRPTDHKACRSLWGELVEHRSRLYGEAPHAGGTADEGYDASAGFEEYLTQINLSGMWVAEDAQEGVVGFIGLKLEGRAGEVDPVIVTARRRGEGIGRALLARVAEEAGRRGLRRLFISPPMRDRTALHALHAAGFTTVSTVTLVYDLGAAKDVPSEPLDLFDLRFRM